MLSILSKRPFWFFTYLDFSPDVFGYIGRPVDKKANTSFKIYDVITQETSSSNTYNAQYLQKSANRTERNK